MEGPVIELAYSWKDSINVGKEALSFSCSMCRMQRGRGQEAVDKKCRGRPGRMKDKTESEKRPEAEAAV